VRIDKNIPLGQEAYEPVGGGLYRSTYQNLYQLPRLPESDVLDTYGALSHERPTQHRLLDARMRRRSRSQLLSRAEVLDDP
jgi:hypothetical protein